MSGASDGLGDFGLWVYLSRTPLLWLTVTLLAYVVADRLSAAFGRHPLANTVLIAVALVASTLIGLVATALTFAAVARLLRQEAEA